MENIPKHNCKNCGACCGPVPITEKEYKQISEYVEREKPKYSKKLSLFNCKFRVDNKCSIYPVRPIMCKLMGVTKGMECTNGNTNNIDGTKFIDFTSKPKGLLNQLVKTKY